MGSEGWQPLRLAGKQQSRSWYRTRGHAVAPACRPKYSPPADLHARFCGACVPGCDPTIEIKESIMYFKKLQRCTVIGIAFVVVGCTSPGPLGRVGDSEPGYKVEDRPGGFTISTTYSRYQFVPESMSVQESCKAGLLASAHDFAESLGRKIEPINEQRLRISMGRNGITGMTSCEASVPVVWAR